MKWFIALCIVSLVSTVACGGGGTTGNAVGTATAAATVVGASTPDVSPVAGDARLADALLTVSDLPPGWSDQPDTPTTSGSATLCNNLSLDQAIVANATGQAFRSFTTGGAVGPFLAEYLVTLPGSDASVRVNTLRDALKSCKQWTEPGTSGGTPTAYTGGELSIPTFGDDSIAFRMTSDATYLGSVQIDFAFVRRGTSLLFVAYAGVSFTALDVDEFISLTRSADDKVRSHGIR